MENIQKELSSKEYMDVILKTPIPKDEVAIWHLGQNSFILRSFGSPTIAIDPYLTDSCGSIDGVETAQSRFLPVFIEPEDLNVDIILITHSHRDHTDVETIENLKTNIHFICPYQVVSILKDIGINDNKISLIHPTQEILLNNLSITGTFALPTDGTDLNHLGYLIKFDNGKKYYNTGDTAFTTILSYLEEENIDLMSICINGGYNNLSHFEAAKVTNMVKPKQVNPTHHDVMPHNHQPPEVFEWSLKVLKSESRYIRVEYYKPFYF